MAAANSDRFHTGSNGAVLPPHQAPALTTPRRSRDGAAARSRLAMPGIGPQRVGHAASGQRRVGEDRDLDRRDRVEAPLLHQPAQLQGLVVARAGEPRWRLLGRRLHGAGEVGSGPFARRPPGSAAGRGPGSRTIRRTRRCGGCRRATGTGRAAWRWPNRAGSRRSQRRVPRPAMSPYRSAMSRTSSVVITWIGVPANTGLRYQGRGRGGEQRVRVGDWRRARARPPSRTGRRGRVGGRSTPPRRGRRRPSGRGGAPCPGCRRRSCRATCVPPGWMHDEPWMIRPTPWRAFSTKCFA